MLDLFNNCPIPGEELLRNLNLFVKRQPLTRVLFLYELYKKILPVHGSIFEFGVRWGQGMALYECFRGILEPYNYNRKIVGFDTFAGFPNVTGHDKDAKPGDMGVTIGYENYLAALLKAHEAESPIPQIQKHKIIKGDATKTLKDYLKMHPETIIALVYFDFDIYEPTKKCLELIKDRLTRGSIIGFDEANNENWPGETQAIQEVLGVRNIRLRRLPWCPTMSYMEVE